MLDFMPGKRFTWKVPSIKGHAFMEGYEILKPGDFILCIDYRALTGATIKYLTKGDFSHACMCVGKGLPDYEVGEMLSQGYTKSYWFDIVHESERVVIMRPNWPEWFRILVVNEYRSFNGTGYDTKMMLGVAVLYCSESVYQAVLRVCQRLNDFTYMIDVSLEDLAGLGRKYISPTGIFKAKNVPIVWDSLLARKIPIDG